MICIEIALSSGQLHFPTLEAFLQYNLIGLEVKNGQRFEGEHRKKWGFREINLCFQGEKNTIQARDKTKRALSTEVLVMPVSQ